MAKQTIEQYPSGIRVACQVFAISETCYRYQPKLSDENAEIADWLVRLAQPEGLGLWSMPTLPAQR